MVKGINIREIFGWADAHGIKFHELEDYFDLELLKELEDKQSGEHKQGVNGNGKQSNGETESNR